MDHTYPGCCALLSCCRLTVVQGSVNKSAETRINELSHELGQSMLVVTESMDIEQFYSMRYGDAVMPEEIVDRIHNSPLSNHVSMLEPLLYGNVEVHGQELILVGFKNKDPSLARGNAAPAVISAGTARTLGLKTADTLQLEGISLSVRQVLDPPPKGFDMAIYTPCQRRRRYWAGRTAP